MKQFRPLLVFLHIAIPLALVGFVRSAELETSLASRYMTATEGVGENANWHERWRIESLAGARIAAGWLNQARGSLVDGVVGARHKDAPPPKIVHAPSAESALQSASAGGVTQVSYPAEEMPVVLARPTPPPPPPYRFLIIGDSMITSSLGVSLEKNLLEMADVYTRRKGVVSTGLSRPDYYDWNVNLRRMIQAYRPNVAVIMMGTNDGSSVYDPAARRFYAYNSQKYRTLYYKRAVELLRTLSDHKVFVVWVGMPVTEKSTLNHKLKGINALQREAVRGFGNARFVDTWDVFRDDNHRVMRFLTKDNGRNYRLRQTDGIHFTPSGGIAMADHISSEIVNLLPKMTPENHGGETMVADTPGTEQPETPSDTKHSFYSRARGGVVGFHVFQPSMAPNEKLPVVYLLHGVTGSFEDWKAKAGKNLHQLALQTRQIIVTPDGGTHGWYLDSPLVEQSAMERYMVEELVPFVDEKFPTNGRRGIVGLSMGGHGAIGLHLKHPGVFHAASSMSGILDLEAHPEQWKIKDLLGPLKEHPERWQAHSAYRLLEQRKQAPTPLLVTVGKNDRYALKDNRQFKQLLAKRGDYHTYQESAGGHSWVYWKAQLPTHLEWMHITLRLPQKGQPVDSVRDFDGRTLLIRAARAGLNDQVRRLMDLGADIHAVDSDDWGALANAALRGNGTLTRLLLKAGAQVDASDRENRTPLMAAAWMGHENTANLLLDAGADINRQDRKGETALIKAAKYNRRRMVSLLLARGADQNLRDNNHDTALIKAARSGGLTVLKILHEGGSDLGMANKKGETLLMIFASRDHISALNYLLEQGVETSPVDKRGKTALILAAEQGKTNAVKRLLEGGASVNIKDQYGQNALHYALLYGQRDPARMLVEAGAPLNLPDSDGASPLMGAVLLGDEKLVQAMLERGADRNYRNKEGKTALELAIERDRQSVIRALEGKTADARKANAPS